MENTLWFVDLAHCPIDWLNSLSFGREINKKAFILSWFVELLEGVGFSKSFICFVW